MKPQNWPERLVWYFILLTYGIYFLGLLYPANTTLAWILLGFILVRLWQQTPKTPSDQRIQIPWIIWVWMIFMILMGAITVISCTYEEIGTTAIIRAFLNWSRDFALLALFPLIGCLNIRPQLIYRAACILCLQSLIAIPIGYVAYFANFPSLLYTSPLERLTQNGPMYYEVRLFFKADADAKELRLCLFAPWAPALGVVANVYFFLALQERNRRWRMSGIAGAITMNVTSLSRLSLLTTPIVLIVTWLVTHPKFLFRPATQITAGFASLACGIWGTNLLEAAINFKEGLSNARASSSRVRAQLGELAMSRWDESPIWGHCIPESPGPEVVARMPIGSHHTWIALLYIKGVMGVVALAVPLICSAGVLIIKAQSSQISKTALSILLVLILATPVEQIELEAYLYWPGLILMGIAYQEPPQTVPSTRNSLLSAADENL